LFKEGIKPLREDDRNLHGGSWLFHLVDGQESDTDRYWTELMLMMIGEGFEGENAHICGAVIRVRSNCRKMFVWIDCDTNQEASIMKIGQLIKDRLHLPHRALSYSTHADTQTKMPPRFTI
jgi:translation initiation factor 4E